MCGGQTHIQSEAVAGAREEGIAQIKKSGGRGFVAVNVDVYIRSLKLVIEESKRGAQFNDAVADLHAVFEEFKDDPAFLGVINFGHVLGDRLTLGMHDFRPPVEAKRCGVLHCTT